MVLGHLQIHAHNTLEQPGDFTNLPWQQEQQKLEALETNLAPEFVITMYIILNLQDHALVPIPFSQQACKFI